MSKIHELIFNPLNRELITSPNTAGNAIATFRFPSEKMWYQPVCLFYRLATDVTVASRWNRVRVYNKAGQILYEIADNASQPASNTYSYGAVVDYGGMTTGFSGSATSNRLGSLPVYLITRGHYMTVSVINGQAGDLLDNLRLIVAVIPDELLRKLNHV